MGITFDIEQQKFIFDFEPDGKSDLVTLTGSGYQVEAFGKCFYYGYEFEPEIDSGTRTKFIQYASQSRLCKIAGRPKAKPDLPLTKTDGEQIKTLAAN